MIWVITAVAIVGWLVAIVFFRQARHNYDRYEMAYNGYRKAANDLETACNELRAERHGSEKALESLHKANRDFTEQCHQRQKAEDMLGNANARFDRAMETVNELKVRISEQWHQRQEAENTCDVLRRARAADKVAWLATRDELAQRAKTAEAELAAVRKEIEQQFQVAERLMKATQTTPAAAARSVFPSFDEIVNGVQPGPQPCRPPVRDAEEQAENRVRELIGEAAHREIDWDFPTNEQLLGGGEEPRMMSIDPGNSKGDQTTYIQLGPHGQIASTQPMISKLTHPPQPPEPFQALTSADLERMRRGPQLAEPSYRDEAVQRPSLVNPRAQGGGELP